MRDCLFRKGLALAIIILFISMSVIPSNAEIINYTIYNKNRKTSNEDKDETGLKQVSIYISNPENEFLINNPSTRRYSYQAYNYLRYMNNIRNKQVIKNKVKNIGEGISDLTDHFNYNTLYKNRNIPVIGDTGIIYVPDDYPTIQSAIDNATEGDTIIVRNGTYTESIVIDKPLTIQSEEGYKNCTISQKGGTYIITVKSDFVTISGFRLKGLDSDTKSGITIGGVNNTTISWNSFYRSYYFIKGTRTNNNTIHDNIMGSSGSYIESWGIWLKNADNNLIYNNVIKDLDMYAVSIHLEESENNTVRNNILRGSYCIGLISSVNNTILDNNMGSGFWAQMYIKNSHYNKLVNNTFPTANIDGIILLSSRYNNISNNVFTKSGIFVYESYKNTMDDNIVNSKPLIYMEEESSKTITDDAGQIILVNCDDITVQNQIISNTIVGIELFKTSNSTILNSNIHSHEYEAIYAVFSHDNIIYNCTFSDCWNAIGLYSCNGNEINSTYIHSIDWETMIISDSHYSKIVWNKITDNFLGIELHSSNYNDICYNELYKLSSNTYNGAIRLEKSKYNNVSFNNIRQHRGIDLYDSSNYNLIFRNFIRVNKDRTVVISKSQDNRIYHNHMESAGGYEEFSGINMWDNGYPSGGNFWIDYTGEDNNDDGIGDTPYVIPVYQGDDNYDYYPLMEPYGNLRANNNGPYYDFINNSIQFNGFVCGGTPPYTWFWDFGDGKTSEEQNPTYTYTKEGKYTIYLSVTDEDTNISDHTSYAWIQESNDPPEKPIIDGPTSGKAGTSYDYIFNAVDPDGGVIWYYIEWGDGINTSWLGPYDSGTGVTKSHSWSAEGTYTIKCKAKDPYDAEGPERTLTVTMPRNRAFRFIDMFPMLREVLLRLINL